MATITVKVKWNKENFELDVDLSAPAAIFKAQLQSKTNVPPERQKFMGLKVKELGDETDLNTVGLAQGKTIMLIGTAEESAIDVSAPADKPVFREDVKGGHMADEAMSNGLQNVGNTCYLNSVVQVLRIVPEVRVALSASSNQVPKQLNNLYNELDKTTKAIAPVRFWNTFIITFPSFGQPDQRGRPQQQDSFEAFTQLLTTIETLPMPIRGKPAITGDDDSPSQAAVPWTGGILHGLHEERNVLPKGVAPPEGGTINLGGHTVNLKPDYSSFSHLQCACTGDVSTLEIGIEKCLTNIIKDEKTGEELYSKTLRIAALPQYLFVHLMRFTWRQDVKTKAKVLKPITFPMILDISSYCTDELKKQLDPVRADVFKRRDLAMERKRREKRKVKVVADGSKKDEKKDKKDDRDVDEDEEPVPEDPPVPAGGDPCSGMYELCGVISHKGRDADGGHYVAWARKASHWLIFDDDQVAQMPEDDVLRLRGVGEAHIAYVLMYRARDPDTGRSPMPM